MPRACTVCTHAERDAIDRAQRSVALLAGLFDRLPEIHDRELVIRWEEPEASPCRKCGYAEPLVSP